MFQEQVMLKDPADTRVETYPFDFQDGMGYRVTVSRSDPENPGAREVVKEYRGPFEYDAAAQLHTETVRRYRRYGGRRFLEVVADDGSYNCPICDQPAQAADCQVSLEEPNGTALFQVRVWCGTFQDPHVASTRLGLWREWLRAEEGVEAGAELAREDPQEDPGAQKSFGKS